MPNKSHRSINEWASVAEDPAFLSVLIQGGLAALLVGLVMLAGGLASPAIALVVLFPILIGQIIGLHAVRSAILYAFAAFVLLGLMHVMTLMPPPVPVAKELSGWILAAAITLATLLFLRRNRAFLDQESTAERVQAEDLIQDFDDLPVLLIDVSEFGRIRSMHGQEDLLPGGRAGREIAPLLSDSAQSPILDLPHEKGRLLIFTLSQSEVVGNRDEAFLEDVAGLGHDLKSPLNAILGFATIMERDPKSLPEAFRDYPAIINDAGQTLLKRIEQLLDLAKAESGALALEPRSINMLALTQDTLAGLSGMADAAGTILQLQGVEACSVFADYDAVVRIVENLVTNAIKYAEPGSKIDILIQPDKRWSRLTVRDQGTGIGAEDLQRIGEPFTQASHTDGREGAGLGLALVKKLVAMQNGEFRIRTAQGRGTEMIIRLPSSAS